MKSLKVKPNTILCRKGCMFCCASSSFVIDARIIFEMATQMNPCVQCWNIHTQLDHSIAQVCPKIDLYHAKI
jgi:hypothetical protein